MTLLLNNAKIRDRVGRLSTVASSMERISAFECNLLNGKSLKMRQRF
jgi:hypothetical protein